VSRYITVIRAGIIQKHTQEEGYRSYLERGKEGEGKGLSRKNYQLGGSKATQKIGEGKEGKKDLLFFYQIVLFFLSNRKVDFFGRIRT